MISRVIVYIRQFDLPMLGAALFLVAMGIVNLSTLASTNVTFTSLLAKQLLFAAVGLGLIFVASHFDYRVIRTRSALIILLWGLALVALVVPMLFGVRVRGAASWITWSGLFVQPVEFVKIILLIVLAKYFSTRNRDLPNPRFVLVSGLYAGIPALIAVLQPDLGSAVLFIAVWFGIVALLGMPVRRLAVLGALMVMCAGMFWLWGLAPYQRARITAYFSPEPHALGAGYQVKQSLIAIGSGSVAGRGFQGALHARLGMLPESATDFSFAALVEQTGLVGAFLIFSAFAVIIIRTIRIAVGATNNFSRAYAAGFAALLFTEATINLGMNLGLLPVTGLPLPFVSYGGSHLLATCLGMGLLESIRRYQPQMLPRTYGFEHHIEDFSIPQVGYQRTA